MNWISQIDQTTVDFLHTFSSLDTRALNWKPNAHTWSIAQNIDHLIVINETYFPTFRALKEGTYKAPFLSKISFIPPFMGKTVLNSVHPNQKKKMKTFRVWEPRNTPLQKAVLKRFKDHQEELKEHIENLIPLLNQKPVIASPANRNIVYPLDTAFDIIATHERRHLEQAKEVLDIQKEQQTDTYE